MVLLIELLVECALGLQELLNVAQLRIHHLETFLTILSECLHGLGKHSQKQVLRAESPD
jgi:hypothetical protein